MLEDRLIDQREEEIIIIIIIRENTANSKRQLNSGQDNKRPYIIVSNDAISLRHQMPIKMAITNTWKIKCIYYRQLFASNSQRAIIWICIDWNENTLRMILTEHLFVIVIIINVNQDNPHANICEMKQQNGKTTTAMSKREREEEREKTYAEIMAMENV